MIANKVRENRRTKFLKMPKHIQRLYKESKCKECSVVVTQMDFAKILGKFTKVKIQYESSSPKTRKNLQTPSPNSRLKRNENGMVLLNRSAYNEHPAKRLQDSTKSKTSARKLASKENNNVSAYKTNNILKENNKLKKNAKVSNFNKTNVTSFSKQYALMFDTPDIKNATDLRSKITLTELLPLITKELLPSEEWCIDYFPKDEEPKDDKVYDRIAAELEDLMYKEKPKQKLNSEDNKTDDFPSILEILNDNNSEKQSAQCVNSNLESSDVEAMLLGKSDEGKVLAPTPMEVHNSDMGTLIADVANLEKNKTLESAQLDANPNSPSILDEALQKGIEEHLPANIIQTEEQPGQDKSIVNATENVETKDAATVHSKPPVTHVIFKKAINGKCTKSVTCPKSLKYSIELQGKSVEFLGAPKFISSIEDLQVLLQIVDESNLDSLYVL